MMQNSNAVVHTVLQNKVFRQKQNGRLKENKAFPDTTCPFKFCPRLSMLNHTLKYFKIFTKPPIFKYYFNMVPAVL